MNYIRLLSTTIVVALFLPRMEAQGTLADYQRAYGLRAKYQEAARNIPEKPTWLGGNRFWYRKSVPGGHAFVMVDAATGAKSPAFDHEKLAASLSKAAGASYTSVTLPFSNFRFVNHDQSIEVVAAEFRWKCSLADYSCEQTGASARRAGDPIRTREQIAQEENRPIVSPDGTLEALIKNFNIYVRPKGKTEGTLLSSDGSEGNSYKSASIAWSPDSKKLAAYRVHPGYRRQVHYVESSPGDQLQPKYATIEYAKPGDVLDLQQPALFLVGEKKQIAIDNSLFPNPYELSELEWRKDSHALPLSTTSAGTRFTASLR